MRWSGLPRRMVLSAGCIASACGDAPSPPPSPTVAAEAGTPRPRAAPPEARVPPQPTALDLVVAGRTIREWVAATAEGDPASPTSLAALPALRRAALSSDLRIADAAETAIRAIR